MAGNYFGGMQTEVISGNTYIALPTTAAMVSLFYDSLDRLKAKKHDGSIIDLSNYTLIQTISSNLYALVEQKANDSDVVHITGFENILGPKLFSSDITVNGTLYFNGDIVGNLPPGVIVNDISAGPISIVGGGYVVVSTDLLTKTITISSNDSQVVHISGFEDITGPKLFSNDVTVNGTLYFNGDLVGNVPIGTAEDGVYTDGLFTDLVPTTPVGTAVDRFNEVLKALAPSPAPPLSDTSINNTGVAGKLSFGSSSPISGYINVPTKDINSSVGTSEVINDGGNNVTLKGIFNSTTQFSGVLNDHVTIGSGTPSAAYPAKTFGDGDVGSIRLVLNGVPIASVALSSSTNAISATTISGNLFVSASSPSRFPNGTAFNVFTYRSGSWTISPSGQHPGYNTVWIERINGSTVTSTRYGWVVDANTTATTFSTEALSGLAMAGSKTLSGVIYHTSGSATYTITASNLHRNSYSSSGTAISHTATRCTVSSSSLGNISGASDVEVISKTATVSTASRILNQGLTVSTTVDRTVQSDVTSTGITTFSLLLDAIAASSTSTTEGFDDEVYRVPSNISITATSGYSSIGASPIEWDSSQSLVSSITGYGDGLLVENSSLKYPTQGTNGGNYSAITNAPSGNVNYSTASGNRTYYRFFYDSNPRQNFRFNVTATSTSFVSVATGPSSNNLTFEVLAPNTTSNGTTTVWKDAVTAYTNDNSVGCYASSNGATIPTSWGMTLGGKNTGTAGNVIIVRITASSAWTGSISNIAITWL